MKQIRIVRLVLACLLIIFIALAKSKSQQNTSEPDKVEVVNRSNW